MNPLEQSIVRTLLYGDVFNFPMTVGEIHYYLIDIPASYADIRRTLEQPSAWLRGLIVQGQVGHLTCYAIAGHEAIFQERYQRETASQQLWGKACHYGAWLGYLPFVRMVGLTGALAVRNASSIDDDLDYILVVREGRVWLARLFAVMVVRLCKLWGVVLCPNYVLAANALAQDDHHLFMAHEITQMVPIVGHQWYHAMREVNAWTTAILPNADGAFYREPDRRPRYLRQWLKGLLEWLLGGRIGNWLEGWEMRRKIRKFQPQFTPTSEVQLDENQVKGHFISYGQTTLQRFQERLEAYNLLTNTITSAAD